MAYLMCPRRLWEGMRWISNTCKGKPSQRNIINSRKEKQKERKENLVSPSAHLWIMILDSKYWRVSPANHNVPLSRGWEKGSGWDGREWAFLPDLSRYHVPQMVSQMDDSQDSTHTLFRTMEMCKCPRSDFLWCRVLEGVGQNPLGINIYFGLCLFLKNVLIYAYRKVHESDLYCLTCPKYWNVWLPLWSYTSTYYKLFGIIWVSTLWAHKVKL